MMKKNIWSKKYSITIEDREEHKSEHFDTDACLLIFTTETGTAAISHLHDVRETGLVLVGCNEVCSYIFEKHPEQKEIVKILQKKIGEMKFSDI